MGNIFDPTDSRVLGQIRQLQTDSLAILDTMHRFDAVNLLDRAFLPARSIERWEREHFPVLNLGDGGSTSSQVHVPQSSHTEMEAESES